MKTTKKILIMSAVALAMAAVANAKADGTFLSPRAQGNYAEMAGPVGTNTTIMAASRIMPNPGALLSPRAQTGQILKTEGTNSDPDLVGLGLTPNQYAYMVGFGLTPAEVYSAPHVKSQPPSTPPYEIAPVK